MLAGVVGGPLNELAIKFGMLKKAGLCSGNPPVGGTQADTYGWYRDAINLTLTTINEAGAPAGYPALPLVE